MKVLTQQISFGQRIKKVFMQKSTVIESGVCALGAFIMANAFIFGTMAPFGVSFAASVKRENSLAAAAGAVLGYTFSYNPTSNIKYIVAVVLMLAANWVIGDSAFGERYNNITVPVVTLLAVMSADFAVFSVSGLTAYDAVLGVSEAALAAGTTFFMQQSLKITEHRENMLSLPPADLSCLIITFAIAMMALGTFTIGGLSVGRVAAVIVILLCAKYGRESAGAVAGVAAGAAMGLLGSSFTFLAAAYGFGGLVAGMFAGFGSFACAGVFLLVNGIVSLVLGNEFSATGVMYEVFLASAVFVLVPPRFTDKLMLARREKTDAVTQTAKDIMLGKLYFAARALTDISATTKQVSDKLQILQPADINSVYNKSIDAACGACTQKAQCWGAGFSSNMDSINHFGEALRRRGKITEEDISGTLGDACMHKAELVHAVNSEYNVYVQRVGTRRRVTEIRGVVTDQFDGMSMMLTALAEELSQIYEIDNRKNRQISDLFLRSKAEPTAASSYEDKFGRLYIEVTLPSFKLQRLPIAELTAELSAMCETNFAMPVVCEVNGEARLQFAEKAALTASYGRAQSSFGGGKLCGDCTDFFMDNKGRANMLISDGMGSGGKAAIDAAMTVSLLTKLINAGFEFDAALKMVNSALLVKSNEESLSTVDIACVDLYSGKTEILKAGAAPSYIMRSSVISKVEEMSMPAGILRGVEFKKSAMTLCAGDIIVMVSDGVIMTGCEWLFPQIRISRRLSAQQMADEIAKAARLRCSGGQDDDITVAVMKLSESA